MEVITVTKDWLADKIKSNPSKVIGRALLAIYNNQSGREKSGTVTVEKNGVGFSKPDARIGSIGARQYRAHKKIAEWQIKHWTTIDKTNYPRICKYVGQLNDIARHNQAIEAQKLSDFITHPTHLLSH